MNFYDAIASHYDDIVDGPARSEAAARFATWLTGSHRVRRALDVACGTGLHARAMAGRGVQVVAADASEAMLQQARTCPGEADDRIEWLHAPMETIAQRVTGSFDAVVCMGNSLPHLLTDARLRQTVRGFRTVLADEGLAAVQMLNYDRILARRERVVGVTRRGHREYIRFYDFLPKQIRFNILELDWQDDRCRHDLHQTHLAPYRAEQLCEAFREAGFEDVDLFGGLPDEPFDVSKSEGLLLIARCKKADGGK